MNKVGLGRFTIILLFAALVAGCGSDAQQRYDRATEALADARERREEAQERVQEKQEELNELQANLDESEERLEKARENMREAEAKVKESVNDQVLFRTIQRKLLDEDKFDESAIAVGVSDRVVTLTGTVPDKSTHKAAMKIAKNQSGVEEVVDFLEIEGEQKQPEAPKNKK